MRRPPSTSPSLLELYRQSSPLQPEFLAMYSPEGANTLATNAALDPLSGLTGTTGATAGLGWADSGLESILDDATMQIETGGSSLNGTLGL